jgi:hypothetical protein
MLTKLILACAATALGGLAVSSAAIAADAESRTLLKNSYQQFGTIDCTFAGACTVNFPATTAENTVITAVSCFFAIPSDGTFIRNSFLNSSNFNGSFALQPFIYGSADGFVTYGINASTNLFLQKASVPYVVVFSYGGATTDLNCTISGYQS